MEKIRKFIKDSMTYLFFIGIFALWCFAMSRSFNYIVFGN